MLPPETAFDRHHRRASDRAVLQSNVATPHESRSTDRVPVHSGPPMAVPKRKTSKARRDKRRAQHGISLTSVNVCPNCGSPTRAHHVCPTCKTYRGRDIQPLGTPAP